ncbi:flagellar protein FlgN [Methylobacterium sp. 17Sr1-1]|uniref:flagellar protein FlgN n=1 Tax=Methylobacterium sp. 17Sr1-1 TaxID=2202826 RepID=UPI000D6FFC76|nr:flagellar protein FlgN [Methylobacterium sp. 17Sr1-1]AWN55694.1 flagellar protein FlgN [Methylobacterium sp. 17Sr1-1]
MLLACIKRLEAVVEEETEALEAHAPADLDDLNRRKSQGLLELTRLTRGLDVAALDATVAIHLARLRDKLARNQQVVALHLRALEEIDDTLTQVALAADSDGTYSARTSPRP